MHQSIDYSNQPSSDKKAESNSLQFKANEEQSSLDFEPSSSPFLQLIAET